MKNEVVLLTAESSGILDPNLAVWKTCIRERVRNAA
jgi:hypothetical protein